LNFWVTRWIGFVLFPKARDATPASNLNGFSAVSIQTTGKPMKSVGPGVREIRVRDAAGAFRVIYIATWADAVYVLHAFQKKTQQTSKRDLMIAETRFRPLRRSATR
jgi:phage-related protein